MGGDRSSDGHGFDLHARLALLIFGLFCLYDIGLDIIHHSNHILKILFNVIELL